MSFTEVLEELPELTVGERQMLVRRALELDEPPLSQADETLVEERLAAHRQNPSSSVPLDEMKKRLRSRFSK
jgi:putative addiction module component (TIGR02574 family)